MSENATSKLIQRGFHDIVPVPPVEETVLAEVAVIAYQDERLSRMPSLPDVLPEHLIALSGAVRAIDPPDVIFESTARGKLFTEETPGTIKES